jgi:uncharacterized protein (DUF2461 family)
MFSKATFNFLDELAANNNRQWFEANKPRYESLVREPALSSSRRWRLCWKNLLPASVPTRAKWAVP